MRTFKKSHGSKGGRNGPGSAGSETKRVILLLGLSGSGKTTFIREATGASNAIPKHLLKDGMSCLFTVGHASSGSIQF